MTSSLAFIPSERTDEPFLPTLTVSISERAYLLSRKTSAHSPPARARKLNARSASLEVWDIVEAERDAEDHVALDRSSALGTKRVGSIAELETHLPSKAQPSPPRKRQEGTHPKADSLGKVRRQILALALNLLDDLGVDVLCDRTLSELAKRVLLQIDEV